MLKVERNFVSVPENITDKKRKMRAGKLSFLNYRGCFYLLVIAEGGYELAVFCLGADGYAEAVLAELNLVAIAYDDAVVYKIVVYLCGIGHLCQKEVV